MSTKDEDSIYMGAGIRDTPFLELPLAKLTFPLFL